MSWLSPKQENLRRENSGVVFLSAGGLGDTVLFSLIFPRLAKIAYKDEVITLIVREESTKLGFLFDANVKLCAVNFDRLTRNRKYKKNTCEWLYRENYRLAISTDFLRHPKKDDVLIEACNANETVGMEPRPWKKYAYEQKRNRAIYDRLFDSGPVILDKVVRWARFADWLTEEYLPPPQIQLTLEYIPPTTANICPTVVFVPFSAVAKKQCPANVFEAITDQISNDYDITIVGTANDLVKNPAFKRLLDSANVHFDDCSFEQLVPVLRAARLVVAVDTAAMHLAVALGTPTLCLASAAYVGEIVPYSTEISPENAHFIYTPMECQGCLGSCIHPLERGMFPCVNRINKGEVQGKVQELLNGRV